MKKFSTFILVGALCFCALLTGCVDIWEGIEGDERVYEIHDYSGSYSLLGMAVKLKRDNTAELFGMNYGYRPVSYLGDEYADYNAQYKACTVVYGNYKQIGNRLKITFDSYTQYSRIEELSGEDAEAFKTAFIENNPDRAEIFGKGEVSQDDIIGKELTLLISDDECKPLKFVTKISGGGEETWTYYSSGEIKSYKDLSGGSKKILEFNTDGSCSETFYVNGVIYSYYERDSKGSVTKERRYGESGKLKQENTYEYEYDSNGKRNCTAQVQKLYDSDGKLMNEEQYEYDSNGNCTAIREYDSDSNLISEKTWTWSYEYDSTGNLIVERRYDSNSNCIAESVYNSEGKLIKQSTWEYDSDGELTKEVQYEYDSNGILAAIKEYDSNGELLSETRYND